MKVRAFFSPKEDNKYTSLFMYLLHDCLKVL